MGGLGSGPQWGGRPLVHDAIALDADELRRGDLIAPGRSGTGTLHWPSPNTGQDRAGVSFRIDVEEAAGRLVLSYWLGGSEGEPVECAIALESVAYAWGGRRWYFRCPLSGRRVSKLYLYPSACRYFASRRELGLAYLSQRQSRRDRAAARLAGIEARLRRRGINPETRRPRRPRRMHRRTFRRLIAERKAAVEEWEGLVLLAPMLRCVGHVAP